MEGMEPLVLLIEISGRWLGLPAQAVAEIVHLPRLFRPPTAPPVVAGVMNLRGRPVAVVRLDRLLGLPRLPPGLFAVAVVLRGGGLPSWAIVAQRAVDVGPLPEPVPSAMPPDLRFPDLSFNDCVARMAMSPDGTGLVPVLAVDRLLQRREAQALAAFAGQAAEREEEWRSAAG